MNPNIYEWVKSEETKFETEQIQLGDNWYWSFRNHVQMIFHLKNGIFYTGENDWLRAFKNIMEPMLHLSYWTEDIEVKDVAFYIENELGKVLSFLVKKYHDEVYVRENDLETLFDDITESDVDYGGILVQKGIEVPEVLQLNSVAFCDQTDTLGGPLALKHFFSPEKLKVTSKIGWGSEKNGATMSLEDLCVLATNEKDSGGKKAGKKNPTPGKVVEVYIIRGSMPEHYLLDNDNMEYTCDQIQVIAFYTDKEGQKNGVTLYRKKENDGNIKFSTSKKVYQRALGRGVGESLVGPQIWTNFLTIHKTNMLEAASKIPLYTDDPSYATKNKIQDMENLEITTIEEGKQIRQVPTAAPANIQLYSNEINSWYEFAQTAASAQDPILGKEAPSGTTFRGQERSIAQGKGIHEKRRGQRAKFIEEIYRDWILDDIKKKILKGRKFFATLSTWELTWISEQLAIAETNKKILESFLNGKPVYKEQQDKMIEEHKQSIIKKGNKHLFEILKGEFEDVNIKMGINIAGKQKDISALSDKYLSIIQFILSNPEGFKQAMQIPALANGLANILEFGGMSIGDFSSLLNTPAPSQVSQPSPIKVPLSQPTA